MNLKALRGAATLSFSVALAGVMFAQGSSSGQQPTTGQRSGMQGMDGQTVTVTGCLVRASDLRGGAGAAAATTPGGTTAGTAGTSGSDYVLSNVQMRSTSPGGATGATPGGTTAGTPGGTTAGAAEAPTSGRGMNLRLQAGSDTKLTEHVNQQVEVTGKLSMSGAGNRGGAGTTGGTTSGAPGTTGTGTTGTGTTGTGTTGTTGAAGSTASAAGQSANNMGQLEVQTIRATGQSCKAGA